MRIRLDLIEFFAVLVALAFVARLLFACAPPELGPAPDAGVCPLLDDARPPPCAELGCDQGAAELCLPAGPEERAICCCAGWRCSL